MSRREVCLYQFDRNTRNMVSLPRRPDRLAIYIMNTPARTSTPPPFILWPLLLGATGFAAGFFGPIAFNPDSNQGPLMGIFITGPGGALLGVVLGLVVRVLPLSPTQCWRVLQGTCVVVGMAALYVCLPEPKLIGEVIDARIVACHESSQALPAAIEYWDKRIAAVTWSPPRANWQADAQRMVRDDPGVVLDVTILRKNAIYQQRKPWNAGRNVASGWQNSGEKKSYFARHAGGSCADYAIGSQDRYFPTSKTTDQWPPDELPNFLDEQVLGPVPDQYLPLIRD